MPERVITPRDLVADHLTHAVAQLESAVRLAKQYRDVLSGQDMARAHALVEATGLAAENVRAGREGLFWSTAGDGVAVVHLECGSDAIGH